MFSKLPDSKAFPPGPIPKIQMISELIFMDSTNTFLDDIGLGHPVRQSISWMSEMVLKTAELSTALFCSDYQV